MEEEGIAVMESLGFDVTRPPASALFLGAHCDDIEIGCGGTLLALRRSYPELAIHWVVLCSNESRERETQAAARELLGEDAPGRVLVHAFRDGFLPYLGGQVKDAFEALKAEVAPDIIFTHHRHDLHQDHRLICELTWNTFRNHLILEYEIPKFDGDLGVPNAFVPISEADVARKVDILCRVYGSQRGKQWFDEETLRGILRLRGVEANSPTRYAEAFYARKVVLRV